MLGDKKGVQQYKFYKDYVLFDLETTGVSSNYDEVIEISALKVRDGKIVDEFSYLVNPGKMIPTEVSMVNHISNEMVKNARHFIEVLVEFNDFIGDDVLVGHNIHSFDMKFIYRDCERFYGKVISNDYVDTLTMAKKIFPKWKHRRLSDLADYYGISTEGAHRALNDCKINQLIYEKLAKEKMDGNTPGTDTNGKICMVCQRKMVKRNGKFGEFWGCTGFPNCRYTENI